MIDIILNLLIFFCTAVSVASCFHSSEGWSFERGIKTLRFFTLLSNIFCALASLAMAACLVRGAVPFAVWLIKYISAASVTVTLMTVMLYLGPAAGYKEMLSGRDFYLHLLGPLLAIVSLCFIERFYPLPLPLALTGALSVVLYGAVYLCKVVVCPEGKRWEDFYGFNKNGKWQISFAAMMVGGILVCMLLWLLYRI